MITDSMAICVGLSLEQKEFLSQLQSNILGEHYLLPDIDEKDLRNGLSVKLTDCGSAVALFTAKSGFSLINCHTDEYIFSHFNFHQFMFHIEQGIFLVLKKPDLSVLSTDLLGGISG